MYSYVQCGNSTIVVQKLTGNKGAGLSSGSSGAGHKAY